MDRIISKYQKKIFVEVEYLLDEIQCRSCGQWFMADYDKMKSVIVEDQARPFAKFFCPYCGAQHRVCV